MDSKLFLSLLDSAESELANTAEAMQAFHHLLAALFVDLALLPASNVPSERGFWLLAQTVSDALANAQSELSMVTRLIRELEPTAPPLSLVEGAAGVGGAATPTAAALC
jgi:hypothetical protein